jgi:hypothetical protein
VWTQVLLQVKEGDLDVSRRTEKITQLVIENKLTTIIRVLQTLFGDIFIDSFSDFTTGDELTFTEFKEGTEFGCNLLLSVKTVIFSTLLRLFSIRIILLRRTSLVKAFKSLWSA